MQEALRHGSDDTLTRRSILCLYSRSSSGSRTNGVMRPSLRAELRILIPHKPTSISSTSSQSHDTSQPLIINNNNEHHFLHVPRQTRTSSTVSSIYSITSILYTPRLISSLGSEHPLKHDTGMGSLFVSLEIVASCYFFQEFAVVVFSFFNFGCLRDYRRFRDWRRTLPVLEVGCTVSSILTHTHELIVELSGSLPLSPNTTSL